MKKKELTEILSWMYLLIKYVKKFKMIYELDNVSAFLLSLVTLR